MGATLSAVIVHYRGGEAFGRCLASCRAAPVDEVVVVDNSGAGAGGADVVAPGATVVPMGRNAGYGVAANAGLERATGDAALVLNQDVVVTPAAVGALLATGEAAGAWLAAPCLVDEHGSPQPPKAGFPPPLRWQPPAGAPPAGARWAPWVSGAAILLLPGHTDLRFDERLFMYAEDEELCWRVWRDGGSVAQVEGATVVHAGGTASRARWSSRAIARRTVVNRARMVAWHAGRRAVPSYLWSVATRRR